MPQELLIALIAAGAALAGSLLGSFLTRTTEHRQWQRDRKYETFLRVMTQITYVEKMVASYDSNNPEFALGLVMPSLDDYPVAEMSMWFDERTQTAGHHTFLAYLTALRYLTGSEGGLPTLPPGGETIGAIVARTPELREQKEKFLSLMRKQLRLS